RRLLQQAAEDGGVLVVARVEDEKAALDPAVVALGLLLEDFHQEPLIAHATPTQNGPRRRPADTDGQDLFRLQVTHGEDRPTPTLDVRLIRKGAGRGRHQGCKVYINFYTIESTLTTCLQALGPFPLVAPPATAIGPRLCLVDGQAAAAHLLAVERRDGG